MIKLKEWIQGKKESVSFSDIILMNQVLIVFPWQYEICCGRTESNIVRTYVQHGSELNQY
jgi:hypothetical protein